MVTHIWSARIDLIFCHFRSIFALLPHYWHQKLKFGKNVKKHLEKLSFYKGAPFIKIICTLDMMYDSWDMKFNRELLCHLGPFFAFYPFNSLAKWKYILKKPLEISSFYTSVLKIMIIHYIVPEMWCKTDVIVIFILGYTSPFYPSNSPKNKNFKKMKKTNAWRYHRLTQVYQKSRSYAILLLRYGTCQM